MTTVSPAEISRYNQLASTWWQADGPMWPLHKLNRLRLPYVMQGICRHFERDAEAPRPLAGLSVLDVGCGAGLLAEGLAGAGARVIGVDPAIKNIEIARDHAQAMMLDIDYRVGSIDAVGADEMFDVVLNMEVVEHVESLPTFIAACCGHTQVGGLQFIATINRTFFAWFAAIVGAEYVLRWLPRGTHQWRKFVTPRETQAMLASHGQRVVDWIGVKVNPLTRQYRLANVLSVNYMVTALRAF